MAQSASATRPLIVFSHANSFGASTYRVLFEALERQGFAVEAIDKFGHDPAFPVTNNWPHLIEHLARFIEAKVQASGQGAYLVGHSLGGFLSLLCAAQHPSLGGQAVRGVVLLDAPVIGGWRAAALRLGKAAGLASRFSPGAVSQTRRNSWPDQPAVQAHFQGKAAFAAWHPQVLQDYVEHGTVDTGKAQRVLSFEREVETAIYKHLPDHTERVLARHPLQCKVAFIGGEQSQEIKMVGMALTQKVTEGRVTLLPGTHLFPMERPVETAAAIAQAIASINR